MANFKEMIEKLSDVDKQEWESFKKNDDFNFEKGYEFIQNKFDSEKKLDAASKALAEEKNATTEDTTKTETSKLEKMIELEKQLDSKIENIDKKIASLNEIQIGKQIENQNLEQNQDESIDKVLGVKPESFPKNFIEE